MQRYSFTQISDVTVTGLDSLHNFFANVLNEIKNVRSIKHIKANLQMSNQILAANF